MKTKLYEHVFVVTGEDDGRNAWRYGSWVFNDKKNISMHLCSYHNKQDAESLHNIAVNLAIASIPENKKHLLTESLRLQPKG